MRIVNASRAMVCISQNREPNRSVPDSVLRDVILYRKLVKQSALRFL